MSAFTPTHILSYEGEDGQMVEELVCLDRCYLYRESEWYAHELPDWTLDDGAILCLGEDMRKVGVKVRIRPIPEDPLPVDAVAKAWHRGMRDVALIAVTVGDTPERVDQALWQLRRLGKVWQ